MSESRKSLEKRKSVDAKSPKSPTRELSMSMADANLTSTKPNEMDESTASTEISKSAAKKAAKKELLAAQKAEKK